MQVNILKDLSLLSNTQSQAKNFRIKFNINKVVQTATPINTEQGTQLITTGSQTISNDSINGWIAEEDFQIGTNNTWTELYNLVAGGGLEQLNNFLIGAGFASLRTKGMYTKVWGGSTTAEFKIPVIFQAESDPKSEVWDKVWDLYKLSVPYSVSAPAGVKSAMNKISEVFKYGNEVWKDVPIMNMLSGLGTGLVNTFADVVNSQFLGSPGQLTPLESVEIGRMLMLKNVRVKDVNINFSLSNIGESARISNSGKTYPMSAKVDVTLMTNTIYTTTDIDNLKKDNILDGGVGISISSTSK